MAHLKFNDKTLKYEPKTKAELEKQAEDDGCYLLIPKPNEVFLDIDGCVNHDIFSHNNEILEKAFAYHVVSTTQSKSGINGHYHIILRFEHDLHPIERIAIQAILGSDLTREAVSLVEEKIGAEVSTCFFEKK